MRVTKRQLRRIIRESLSLLSEEGADYVSDYRAGGLSRRDLDRMTSRYDASQGNTRQQRSRSTWSTGVGQDSALESEIKNALYDYKDTMEYEDKRFLNGVAASLERLRSVSDEDQQRVRDIIDSLNG
jgi:hypothetical protein